MEKHFLNTGYDALMMNCDAQIDKQQKARGKSPQQQQVIVVYVI